MNDRDASTPVLGNKLCDGYREGQIKARLELSKRVTGEHRFALVPDPAFPVAMHPFDHQNVWWFQQIISVHTSKK
eukprot:SAG31_NODE_823_length_11772_cov_10.262229_2_plen_75_part_00